MMIINSRNHSFLFWYILTATPIRPKNIIKSVISKQNLFGFLYYRYIDRIIFFMEKKNTFVTSSLSFLLEVSNVSLVLSTSLSKPFTYLEVWSIFFKNNYVRIIYISNHHCFMFETIIHFDYDIQFMIHLLIILLKSSQRLLFILGHLISDLSIRTTTTVANNNFD